MKALHCPFESLGWACRMLRNTRFEILLFTRKAPSPSCYTLAKLKLGASQLLNLRNSPFSETLRLPRIGNDDRCAAQTLSAGGAIEPRSDGTDKPCCLQLLPGA